MLNKKNTKFIYSFIKAKLRYKNFFPFMVGFSLTRRCNYRCKYCNEWDFLCEELDTKQIFSIMDELANLGTTIIALDGGEPLLREDLGSIIDYAKKKDFIVTVNTNGSLVPKKIQQIKNLDLLNISLDGPAEVHDYIRGKNSYEEVMEAVEVSKKNNIPLKFNCTISRYNSNYIDFIVNKAKELKVKVKFEPISYAHFRKKKDILESMYPTISEYKKVIEKIISCKKTNKYIMNSTIGLKYIQNWPFPKRINCFASKFLCRIEPNGDLFPCTMARNQVEPRNCIILGVKEAFECLPGVNCEKCWCTGTLEFNYLLSCVIGTIWDNRNFFKK